MDDVRILQGDAVQVLRTLASGSVHCVVTSPPYWGLRDYGTATWVGGDAACDHRQAAIRIRRNLAQAANACDGGNRKAENRTDHNALGIPYSDTCGKCGAVRQDHQLGLEKTPDEYVARLVEVFREVWRVMRPDATLWLNLGDSYASGKGTCYNPGGGAKSYIQEKQRYPLDRGSVKSLRNNGLKPKDLCGIPWRVAFALQADGWWLRSEIIWAKRAPMPESVTDRPTRSHEQIFLLTKSARYFYDAEAVREGLADSTLNDRRNGTGRHTQGINYSKYFADESPDPEKADKPSWYRQKTFVNPETGRNMRDVWTLGPEPYPEAHFAVFPREIPRRAILAGTSARGCCPACGAPWTRVVECETVREIQDRIRPTRTAPSYSALGQNDSASSGVSVPGNAQKCPNIKTLGWQPTCECSHKPRWSSEKIFGGARGEFRYCVTCHDDLAIADAPRWYDGEPEPEMCTAFEPIPCTVLDPFLGSGTTLAVAVELGRHGVGIELNEKYIELAHERIGRVQRPLLVG